MIPGFSRRCWQSFWKVQTFLRLLFVHIIDYLKRILKRDLLSFFRHFKCVVRAERRNSRGVSGSSSSGARKDGRMCRGGKQVVFKGNWIKWKDKGIHGAEAGLGDHQGWELFKFEKVSLVAVSPIRGVDNMANIGNPTKWFPNVSYNCVYLVAVSLITRYYCRESKEPSTMFITIKRYRLKNLTFRWSFCTKICKESCVPRWANAQNSNPILKSGTSISSFHDN